MSTLGEDLSTDRLWASIPSPLPEEPPIDPALVSPGLLGLAAFLFLVIAVALLYRSMRNQMKKVSPDLPNEPPREPTIPVVDSPGATDSAPAAGEGATDSPTAAEGDPPARD